MGATAHRRLLRDRPGRGDPLAHRWPRRRRRHRRGRPARDLEAGVLRPRPRRHGGPGRRTHARHAHPRHPAHRRLRSRRVAEVQLVRRLPAVARLPDARGPLPAGSARPRRLRLRGDRHRRRRGRLRPRCTAARCFAPSCFCDRSAGSRSQKGRTSRAMPCPRARVSTSVASSSPASASRLRSCSGDDVDAALLDRQRADAALAQRRAQGLLAVRQLLEHAVAPRERGAERLVGGDVGDRARRAAGRRRRRRPRSRARPGSRRRRARRGSRPPAPPSAPGVVVLGERREAAVGRSRSPGARCVASRPDQSAASLTSPWSLTHSASTPGGTSECGMPGATFTQAARVSSGSTNSHDGVQASASERAAASGPSGRVGEGDVEAGRCRPSSRPRPRPRRASPRAARLASATATRTGSRSTPAVVSPAAAKATRSPPMPQPRSMTVLVRPHGGGRRGARPRRPGWPARDRPA